jgi:hypothetical protein
VRLAGQIGGGAELLMAARSASIPAHIPAPAADQRRAEERHAVTT